MSTNTHSFSVNMVWIEGKNFPPHAARASPQVLQDRLSQQQRDMEEERSRLQEVIAKMEARLSEQTRLLEQVSPHCVLCPGRPSCLGMGYVSHQLEVPGLEVVNSICHLCV